MNWKKKKQQKRRTPPARRNNSTGPADNRDTCLAINIIFAAVILFVFVYSGLFRPEKNNYPLECVHEMITGEPCPSCGLSRSFSYIIRGDIAAAEMQNVYGMRVFLFFLFQLVMRLSNIVYLLRKPIYLKELTLADSLIAIITFMLAFRQFFFYYLEMLFH
ncbi:MAG TPA: DUF2752 domain-containing protein [Desulfobacteraceae bacterium]|nr:DUF2752 domain-containing protein [Desulfobacteraceae bacterium]